MSATIRTARTRAAQPSASSSVPPVGRLDQLVDAFGIDTVLLGTVDTQGRLKGKEFDAAHLVERLRSGALAPEMCGYVIGTDLGMAAPANGPFSWASGFGDIALLPDVQRARVLPWLPWLPWLPSTVVVFADPISGGLPHPLAPATVLAEQQHRLASLGVRAGVGGGDGVRALRGHRAGRRWEPTNATADLMPEGELRITPIGPDGPPA
ncbi:hypothetical protein [Kitasatospora sp. NPDC093806]|uniref:hypothetical protein n=1 Tax=Kitasatospora sp. NPDC093806 TaxID=3155075 RepID=UPI003424D091